MDIFQSNSLRDIAKEKAASELQTAYAKLEKSVELYQSSNYQLEKDFEKIISGVNANFEKRNISMLEFLDYYQAYKETCLQLYDTEENVVLNIENLNSVVGQNVINY
jgi:cobalt-zinc-cadmium efflux system outer membrane protein